MRISVAVAKVRNTRTFDEAWGAGFADSGEPNECDFASKRLAAQIAVLDAAHAANCHTPEEIDVVDGWVRCVNPDSKRSDEWERRSSQLAEELILKFDKS